MRTLFCFVLILAGCELNVFEPFEDTDTPAAHAEEGRLALDRGDFDRAIAELEEAVSAAPTDASYKADLASAYAGRAGFRLVRAAYRLQDGAAGTGEVNNGLLRSITGVDTFEHIDSASLLDLTAAIAILDDVVAGREASAELRLQRAITQLAHAAVAPLAIADLNRDRLLDIYETVQLSDAICVAIVADIREANGAIKQINRGSAEIGNLTDRIDLSLRAIDAMPSSNEAERIRMYVAEQFAPTVGSSQYP